MKIVESSTLVSMVNMLAKCIMLIVLFLFNQIVEIHRFFSLNGLFLNTKKW